MTYDQARSIIFQATSRYFTGATVVIGNSKTGEEREAHGRHDLWASQTVYIPE